MNSTAATTTATPAPTRTAATGDQRPAGHEGWRHARNQRVRNWTVFALLIVFIILVYVITLVQLSTPTG